METLRYRAGGPGLRLATGPEPVDANDLVTPWTPINQGSGWSRCRRNTRFQRVTLNGHDYDKRAQMYRYYREGTVAPTGTVGNFVLTPPQYLIGSGTSYQRQAQAARYRYICTVRAGTVPHYGKPDLSTRSTTLSFRRRTSGFTIYDPHRWGPNVHHSFGAPSYCLAPSANEAKGLKMVRISPQVLSLADSQRGYRSAYSLASHTSTRQEGTRIKKSSR